MGGSCGTYGMEENFVQGLVRKPNWKKTLNWMGG